MKVISEISVVSTLQDYQKFNRADPYSVHPRKVRSIEKIEEVAEENGYDVLPLIELLEIPPSSGRGGLPVISNGEVKIVKPANLTDLFFVDLTDCERTTLDAYNSSEKGRLQDLDILVLSAAHAEGYIGTNTSIVHLNDDEKAICIGELIRLRPNIDRINPYYLTLYLNSIIGKYMLNYSVRGQTVHLYPKDIEYLPILLPPRKIQDSIGNKLKQAIEAKIEAEKKRRKIENIFESYLQSTKITNFSTLNYSLDYVKIARRCDPLHFYYRSIWESIQKSLANIRKLLLRDCLQEFPKAGKRVEYKYLKDDKGGTVCYIDIKDIQEIFVIESDSKIPEEAMNVYKCEEIEKFDILLSRVGTLGNVSIFLGEKKATYSDNVFRLRCKDDMINPYYLISYFTSKFGSIQFNMYAKHTLQPVISSQFFENAVIFLFPENKEIADYTDKYIRSKLSSKQLHSQAMEEFNKLLSLNAGGDKS